MTAPQLILFLAIVLATAANAIPVPTSLPPAAAASVSSTELGGAALQQLVTKAANVSALAKAAVAPAAAGSPDLRHKDLNELLSYVKNQMTPASAPSSKIFNQITAGASDAATPPATAAAAATPTTQTSGTTMNVVPSAAALFAAAFVGYFMC